MRLSLLASLFCITLSSTSLCYAQQREQDDLFCGKKWYCEMTKDGDGTPHTPDSSAAGDYMHFLCDSTFILKEKGITLKGNWEFNDTTMTITLRQSQLNTIPESFSFHIIDFDEGHLVIIGQEGTKNEETAYLYSK